MELFVNEIRENAWPIVKDMKGRLLLGKFIGTIVEAVDRYTDYDGSTEYVEEYYLAYQLFTGSIVAVEFHIDDLIEQNKTPVHSLAKKQFYMLKGFYPIGFPREWMAAEEPVLASDTKAIVDLDDLPF